MKKTLFVATFLVASMPLFSQKTDLSTNEYTTLRGERMGNCSGSKGNICGFEKKENSAVVISKETATQLKISIDLSKLSNEEQVGWLGKTLKEVRTNEEIPFLQEFKIPLDADLVRDLNLESNSFFIAPGNYKMTVNQENKLEIVLNLSNK